MDKILRGVGDLRQGGGFVRMDENMIARALSRRAAIS